MAKKTYTDPDDDHTHDQDLAGEFNWQWREVIKHVMDGKKLYEAYGLAYDIEYLKDEGNRRVCEANSSRLLRNAKFKKLWRAILEEVGFNDDVVDSTLIDLITNPKYPPVVRRAAIRDYNELQGRIIKKVAPTDAEGKSLFDQGDFKIEVVKGRANKPTAGNSTKRPA